ncbi:MAG: four helix bundle protein [Candidatus Sumerlaeaceae bacterium]
MTKPYEVQKKTGPPPIRDRTFDFAVTIVKLCIELEQAGRLAQPLVKQMLRSATSIGANVEEAYGSQSQADFAAKIGIARKEARETLYWLRLLIATGLVAEMRLRPLVIESNELVAILTAIYKKVQPTKRSPDKAQHIREADAHYGEPDYDENLKVFFELRPE